MYMFGISPSFCDRESTLKQVENSRFCNDRAENDGSSFDCGHLASLTYRVRQSEVSDIACIGACIPGHGRLVLPIADLNPWPPKEINPAAHDHRQHDFEGD